MNILLAEIPRGSEVILQSLCSMQKIFTVAVSKFVYFVSHKDTFYFIS